MKGDETAITINGSSLLQNTSNCPWDTYYMGLKVPRPSEKADNIDIKSAKVKENKVKANSEEDIIRHYKEKNLAADDMNYKEEHVATDDLKLEGTGMARDLAVTPQLPFTNLHVWVPISQEISERIALRPHNTLQVVMMAAAGKPGSSEVCSTSIFLDVHFKLVDLVSCLQPIASTPLEETQLIQEISYLEEQSNQHEMSLMEHIK
ncbi:hypothetical protein VP01_3930g3 [Puccinia sorghi]|uniref:Uncharacterized protein n=1 Tax=Puccinia sorghi TaxID=27349 RepID=A0A0L6USL0_9BASI|nr:hypothetical protein VP01_3930g3 [Puccinia sorghi]